MAWRSEQRIKIGIVVIIFIVSTLTQFVFTSAQPIAPQTMDTISSSRRVDSPVQSVQAMAGNVTELRINATVVTKSWAGYYGNITGTIVLDDALNNSMYRWSIETMSGEIYASQKTADFSSSNIICANSTHVEEEEQNLSIGSTDYDGVNETFSYLTHPTFSVGSKLFDQDTCNYTMSTYVNDREDQSRRFNETLLYDQTNNQIVYMALLVNNQDGFKIGTDNYDFQMLVGEDGHDNSDTTRYYFYVELQ